MNPASADAAELIATLCIAAPLTFAGLLVAIDPVKFLKLVNTFSDGLRRFRDHLHSPPWEDPFLGPHEAPDSARTRSVVRCAGLALALLGLVLLAGIAG